MGSALAPQAGTKPDLGHCKKGKEICLQEEEINMKEELCEELETPPTAFKLHFDGAFSPSTKCGTRGIILFDPEEKALWARGRQFPEAISNNVAEYNVLIYGLEDCFKEGVKEVEVKGDSQLVIRQMNGVYKARSLIFKIFIKEQWS